MAVAYSGTHVAARGTSAAQATGSITVSGSNPVLLIGIAIDISSGKPTVSSVTFGGTGTPVFLKAVTQNTCWALLYVVAAPSGSGVVTVNLSASRPVQIDVALFTGADQTTPCPAVNAAAAGQTGSGTSQSVTAGGFVTGDGAYGFQGHTVNDDCLGVTPNQISLDSTTTVNFQDGYSTASGTITFALTVGSSNTDLAAVVARIVQPVSTPNRATVPVGYGPHPLGLLNLMRRGVVAHNLGAQAASPALTGPTATVPKVWLKADAGAYSDAGTTAATDGQTVRQWNDQSGNGNHATQATSGNRPTYHTNKLNGLPSLTFTRASSHYLTHLWAGEPKTAFFVVRPASVSNDLMTVAAADTTDAVSVGAYYFQFHAATKWFCARSTTADSINNADLAVSDTADALAANTPYILKCWRTDGTIKVNPKSSLDGVSQLASVWSSATSGNALRPIATPCTLGAGVYGDAVTNFLDGEICEVLLYDGTLSDDEVVQVEAYLWRRWGFGVTGTVNYLLTTFEDPGASNERLRVLESSDGASWYVRPSAYTAPTGHVVRDPTIYYDRTRSKWWAAHTNLTSFTTLTTSFDVASSTDAFAFDFVATVDCTAITGINRCWAPEWFVDPTDGSVHIIFAASTNSPGATANDLALYETHPTNAAYTTWSAPVALSGVPTTGQNIDAYVVYTNGAYYLWYRSNQGPSNDYIQIYKASSLTGTYSSWRTGDWLGFGTAVAEGSSVLQLLSGTWAYYGDKFNAGTGIARATQTAGNWIGSGSTTWSALSSITVANDTLTTRHGTVVYLPLALPSEDVRVGYGPHPTALRRMMQRGSLPYSLQGLRLLTAAAADTLSVTESPARQFAGARTAADAPTFSDTVARVLVAARAAADTLTATEALTRAGVFARTTTDTLTATEALARAGVFARTTTDTLTATETVARGLAVSRTVADALTLTEAATRVDGLARAAADAPTFSETGARVVAAARDGADALTATEALTRAGDFSRTVTDAAAFSEASDGSTNVSQVSAQDAVGADDSAARLLVGARDGADALALSEVLARAGVFARDAVDTTAFAEAVDGMTVVVLATADEVDVGDIVAAMFAGARSGAQTLTSSETLTAVKSGVSVFVVANRVHETSAVTGTGAVTLLGAETRKKTFASVMNTNDVCFAVIEHRTAGEWEVSLVTMQADGTLARAAVPEDSSNFGSLVQFSAGVKDVFLDVPASMLAANLNLDGYTVTPR